MKPQALLAGVGALAFPVATLIGFIVGNPPGGTYKSSDVADFLAKSHRPSVFISIYLILIAAIGLLAFMARLRDAIATDARRTFFWGLSIAATGAWIAGYAVAVTPAMAMAFGGSRLTIDPTVAFTIGEGGWGVMYGGGGLLLGCALLTFALGPVTVPAWVRWSTLVGGIASIASVAWFPMFIVFLWSIVVGLWLLVAGRSRATQAAPQAA